MRVIPKTQIQINSIFQINKIGKNLIFLTFTNNWYSLLIVVNVSNSRIITFIFRLINWILYFIEIFETQLELKASLELHLD